MYLKRLDLIGFKSFPEPTALTFKPGITAIVGPNGCGKSNIVDCILWVLGEQSTKALRSDRMEDVIFNGTEARKPLGMAEVVLTMEGITGELENVFKDYHELALARRLYRSGDSEYLINKIPCRLKDLRDVLIDTGVGFKGHTVIEQGKVDQLINSSPQDRRALIEETAGIVKYNLRKAEAERKLEATEQNLLRVKDIIAEVKRQIGSLDRQVKKAQQYQQMTAELKSARLTLLQSEYRELLRSGSELSSQAEALKAEEARLLSEVGQAESAIQQERLTLSGLDRKLSEARQRVFDVQTQIQRQESRIELLLAQMNAAEEQRRRREEELSGLSSDQQRTEDQILQWKIQQKETADRIREQETQSADCSRSIALLEQQFGEVQRSLEEARGSVLDLLNRITEVTNTLAGLTSRKQEILRITTRGQEEREALVRMEHQIREDFENETSQAAQIEQELAGQQEVLTRLSAELRQAQEQFKQDEEDLVRQQERLHLGRAHLNALVERQKAEPNRTGSFSVGLKGWVADLIEVPAEYERAVEALLGDRLGDAVVETIEDASEAVRQLKASGGGRATLIPLSLRSIGRTSRDLPRDAAVIGRVRDRVRSREGFEPIAEYLLGEAVLVRDLESAFRFWGAIPEVTWVTLEGEVLEGSGVLTGGTATDTGGGLLQTRREIQDLSRQVAAHESELQRLQTVRAERAGAIERLNREMHQTTQSLHALELRRATNQQHSRTLELELARLGQRLSDQAGAIGYEEQELVQIERRLASTQEKLAGLTREQQSKEASVSDLQRIAVEMAAKREEAMGRFTQLKVDHTGLIEKSAHLGRETNRLEQSLEESRARQNQIRLELEDLALKQQAFLRDREQAQAVIADQARGLSVLQSEAQRCAEDQAQHQVRLSELEARRAAHQQDLQGVQSRQHDNELRLAEWRLRCEHLETQAREEHQADLKSLPQVVEPPPSLGELARLIEELQAKMDRLGPVNMAALEEYRELEQRYQFLTQQSEDLTKSIEDLREAISKINKTTRQLFEEAYATLRARFNDMFVKFFGGGRADLILLDPNNPLDSGIDILAQPPGKKLRSIALLSGGEKALTAISLLFASFLIHPSPFCVLDEIDAPLDEENVGRFLRALREMAHPQTTDVRPIQFLIITHNRRTMEAADTLYGVTMEEPGVSRTVSVRLQPNGNGTAVSDVGTVAAGVTADAMAPSGEHGRYPQAHA
jgi:chromosome segregation protein